jgi:DNA-binding MarR family transcriptional regulator
MDYRELADNLLYTMGKLSRTSFQKDPRAFSQGELGMMFLLDRIGKETTAGSLSTALEVSTGRVASALKNLEKKNLIQRYVDPADRRRVLVKMTDRGKAFCEQKKEEGISKMEELLLRLGQEDAQELVRLMGRMAELSDVK